MTDGRIKFFNIPLFFLALLAAFLAAPAPAMAGVNAGLEWDYGVFNTKTTDKTTNETSQSRLVSFEQIYRLDLSRRIYPHLEVHGGGIFDRLSSKSTVDGTPSITSTTRTLRPYAGVSFGTAPFSVGLDYSSIERTTGFSGSASSTQINDSYNAIFGWRPDGLPPLTVQYSRAHQYDEQHLLNDITSDSLSWSTSYSPLKNLLLAYEGSWDKSKNNLNDTTFTDLNNSGRVSYARGFFNNRVMMNTDYNTHYDQTETEVTTTSSGLVYFQVFPFNGFSLESVTAPATTAFQQNPDDMTYQDKALTDGDTKTSAGIDVGWGNYQQKNNSLANWNMGLKFQDTPAVNALFVYVDRDVSQLLSEVPNPFNWQVCTSADNQNWSCQPVVALYQPFGQPPNQNPRFEIDLPGDLNSTWVKVVVNPLNPSTPVVLSQSQFQHIYVTEVQAFERKQAREVQGQTETASSSQYDLSLRASLLSRPQLFYDFNLIYSINSGSGQPSTTNYTISNGFTVLHRFSSILTGTARVSRDEVENEAGTGTSYLYSASLTAVPVPALNDNLIYSGSTSSADGITTTTNAVFLNNTAELYQGISAYARAGVNFGSSSNGIESTSYTYNFGSTLTPYRTLSLNMDYSESHTSENGVPVLPGVQPSTVTPQASSEFHTNTADVSVSWSPFSTLYAVLAIDYVSTEQTSRTAYNYNVSWSPFPYGAVQFSFAYNESIGTGPDAPTSRTISPSMRWRIAQRTFLDVSYAILKSEDDLAVSNSDSVYATFKKFF